MQHIVTDQYDKVYFTGTKQECEAQAAALEKTVAGRNKDLSSLDAQFDDRHFEIEVASDFDDRKAD